MSPTETESVPTSVQSEAGAAEPTSAHAPTPSFAGVESKPGPHTPTHPASDGRRRDIGITVVAGLILLAALVWQTVARPALHTADAPSDVDEAGAPGAWPDMRLNLNRASIEELTMLPGIGESLARRIVDYRDENGPFRSPADLDQVPGVGERLTLRIAPFITVQ